MLSMLFGFELLKFPVRTVAMLEQVRLFYSFESSFVNLSATGQRSQMREKNCTYC